MEKGTMMIDVGTALTVLSFAFGAWAWVVAWGVKIIRHEMGQTRAAAAAAGQSLENHILATERRLTMLETEFGFIRRYLARGLDKDDES
jgi:hypothetical protein